MLTLDGAEEDALVVAEVSSRLEELLNADAVDDVDGLSDESWGYEGLWL